MRIVIDARVLGWTGIGRYVHHLLLELEQVDHHTEYLVLLRDGDRWRWSPQSANFSVVPANFAPHSMDEQLKLPALLHALKPDLVHFTSFNAPLMYGAPSIVTVHDLTLITFRIVPGTGAKTILYELKHWAGRFAFWCVTHSARHIIVDTAFVRNELLRHLGKGMLSIAPEKVTAIHLATDFTRTDPRQPDWIDASTPFVLYVGTYYPYKNIDRLLEAFAQLVKAHATVKLVLAGKSNYFQQQHQLKAAALGLDKRVIFPGFVPDEALAWLYEHAQLCAFVSLSEGFGLPGLEAMAAGTPVLSSTATCLPEVYGDAALYCDPLDPGDIAKQMSVLLYDENLRHKLIEAGRKQIGMYSWRRMAEQTLEIYRETLSPT